MQLHLTLYAADSSSESNQCCGDHLLVHEKGMDHRLLRQDEAGSVPCQTVPCTAILLRMLLSIAKLGRKEPDLRPDRTDLTRRLLPDKTLSRMLRLSRSSKVPSKRSMLSL